ncbi:lanthionine synthetase C family protein [Corallococcus sp. bb12-1]|uniref:lanthionine synthetase C family protein n=1 Tax=Corallococcus sp. bb12-1 TaxID=2996784 RepID=UPI00226F38C7|nr:lanthionine synthetase C family protein [Corallococcus sp. bb12-1]MCY1044849.1 lanthionine synthetase C family protein [Corallococcus sp. bb12-1]
MRRTPSWKPLLQGVEHAEALAVLEPLVEALAHVRPTPPFAASLARGAAGRAVLFDALARAHDDARHRATAEALLERATEALSSETLGPDLYDGFTGIAWAVQHVQRPSESPDADPLTDIDDALGDFLQTRPWPHRYDLVSGLVGMGVYALERLPRAGARHCLEAVVARLGELAERTPEGLRWKTVPEHVEERLREAQPLGGFNLGMAHGISGVLTVLGGAVASGVESARELLHGGWTWFMSRRGSDTQSARFPTRVDLQHEPLTWPHRPAWCYGDPGVALGLHTLARAVGHAEWEAQALALCRESARRWTDGGSVEDGGLCHGAAGLAHLYNRLFQTTGEAVFETAARFWFAQLITVHWRPGQGVGGFRTLERFDDDTEGWTDNPGLLAGATGVALALLAATSAVEPTWDRMMLMSLRHPTPDAP